MPDSPREQRLVFGEVAEAYDQARPGYPSKLVDDVVAFAALAPDDRVLEVGCGTGKATVQFARHGCAMLCLEPSEPMAAVARRNGEPFPRVTVETASFEDSAVEPGAFRLLISAQAWHWASPEVRLPKAHRSLAPDGVLAVFWNTVQWRDEQLRTEIDHLYERVAPDLVARRPGFPGTRSVRNVSIQELDESSLFGPVVAREYPWSETYTTSSYLELLSTHSDHRMLPTEVFDQLAGGLGTIIDRIGGSIRVDYATQLFLARHSSEQS
jgi:SAM-dependent methyltransferase